MSQPERTAMLYEQIIARVIGDSRERFAAEGADTAVLSELQKLWWEKLQHSGIVGSSFRGAGGVGGAGGYHHHHHHHHHHLPPKAEDHVLQFPSGAPPARMAPSHAGSEAYGKVNVKHELPQTDGADVAEGDAGVAASRSVRRPRRGDYVEVQVGLGVEGSAAAAGGPAILSLQQLDGAGSGPRKRKLDEEDDEDDLGADDDDEELNSDDDDDEEESEIHTDNLVLCQYDKVTRTKNKWKAQLKFGVMTLNHHDGRKQDFIFNKAAADMNFAN